MPNYINFAELKANTRIEQVFPMLDLQLQKKGDQWRGQCPICEGNDRSFVVTASKQAWYCFGCSNGGDVIALVAFVRDLSMKDAAHAIADELVTVTVDRNSNSTSTVTVPDSSEGEGEGRRTLQPLSYLQSEHPLIEALGLSPETCDRFGAGYAPKGIMRGRLAIPIHDLTGELVAYCGRAVKDEQKPVLSFPKGFDPARHVFNLHRMQDGELYCTSDPLDVLLAFENGVENAIAFLHRPANVVKLPVRDAS